MHAQNQNQGPRFLWTVGFLALGTLSAIGASSLFPWYLAVVIAILVAGLASACAFQFRSTGNLLYLVATVAMTVLAAGLDGVSVWEILNKRQNQELSASRAEESVYQSQLEAAEAEIVAARTEIEQMVQAATDMDNDGKGDNDHLIPGQLARIEAKRADLAGLVAAIAPLRSQVVSAAAVAAKNDTGRHVLLQIADQQEKPAQWLILRAALIFAIPEFTLALLAWSLRSSPQPAPTAPPAPYYPAPARGLAALTAMPEQQQAPLHQAQPQQPAQPSPQTHSQAPLPAPPRQHTEVVAAASPPAARRKTSHVKTTRERDRAEEPNEVSNPTDNTPTTTHSNRTTETTSASDSGPARSPGGGSNRATQAIKAKRNGPSKLFSRGKRAHPEAGMVLNN